MKVIRSTAKGVFRFFKVIAHLPAFIKQGGAIYVTVEERDNKKLLAGKNIIITGGALELEKLQLKNV